MPWLAILRHEEGVRLEADPLVALVSELGAGAAEQRICRAMTDLEARLTLVQRRGDEGRTDLMAAEARQVAAQAWNMGLASLARVAHDVANTAEAGDHPALAATVARLVRVGERSLAAVWELRDLTL
ncbi:MAG: hypothetical protein ORN49_01215 [Rhodobacteraceae bacterium]|nr:hypothetical protein [Paracoccaceae bacterium]